MVGYTHGFISMFIRNMSAVWVRAEESGGGGGMGRGGAEVVREGSVIQESGGGGLGGGGMVVRGRRVIQEACSGRHNTTIRPSTLERW
jgi:hypothetical protein